MINMREISNSCSTEEEEVNVLKEMIEEYDKRIEQEHNFCVRFKGRFMTTVDTTRSGELKLDRAMIFRRLEILTDGKWCEAI